MNKKASNGEPLDVPVSAGEIEAVATIRRFQVNDVVRIIAEGQQEYIVLVHRDNEPCCQIQRNDGLNRREWMISEELELVAETAGDDPSGLSKVTTSATLPPRTRIS